MEQPRADGTRSAKVITVIKTTAKRGLGTKEDPVRLITQYWDLEGEFLAEFDKQHCIPLIEYEADVLKKSIPQK